ncbi:MAG TPA: Sip1-related alpha-galactosidase, partial [bacterium]
MKMNPCLRSMPDLLPVTFFCLALTSITVNPVRADAGDHAPFSLSNGTLWLGRRPVLQNVPEAISIVEDTTGAGVFLKAAAADPSSFLQFPLGVVSGLRRFTSCRRDEPFWMVPASGRAHGEVQAETQWLLVETEQGDYVMLVPLLDGVFRFSLTGGPSGLTVIGETGDPFTPGKGGTAIFLSV